MRRSGPQVEADADEEHADGEGQGQADRPYARRIRVERDVRQHQRSDTDGTEPDDGDAWRRLASEDRRAQDEFGAQPGTADQRETDGERHDAPPQPTSDADLG